MLYERASKAKKNYSVFCANARGQIVGVIAFYKKPKPKTTIRYNALCLCACLSVHFLSTNPCRTLLQQLMADHQNTRSKGKTRPVEAELSGPPQIVKHCKVGNVKAIVRGVKVSSISLVQPQDGPVWYQGLLWATLPNRKSVKIRITKQI